MFGRKKKDEDLEDVVDDDEAEEADEDDEEEDDEDEDESAAEGLDDDDEEEEDDEEPLDEWSQLDVSRDWREDGPFDIGEVDLDADDIQRLDFGTIVVTPFDGMKLDMLVSQSTGKVQSLQVVDGKSSIEIALFAAPLRSSMLAEVRDEMEAATEQVGGTMKLVKGPLGTEVRRKLPTTEGGAANQASRTWMVQGPRWLLRGVMTGPAASTNDVSKGEAQLLFEFFCNLVVRRGESPKVPGELIAFEIPESVAAGLAGK